MARFWFGMGCLAVGLAVAAGAFGAHALKQRLAADLLAVFDTGVRYQMLHGLGLVALALAMDRWGGAVFQWAGWLWLAGILLFSGSLYALSLTGVRGLGAVTPPGGRMLSAGMGVAGLGGLAEAGLIAGPGVGSGAVPGQALSF